MSMEHSGSPSHVVQTARRARIHHSGIASMVARALLVCLLIGPAEAQPISPGQTASPAASASATAAAVTIAVDRWPESFDPALEQSGPATVLANLNEPVVRLKPNSSDIDAETSLASKVAVSEDGKLWEIQLKGGLLFSDGSPLDAEAVAFSLGRLLLPAHPARPLTPRIPASARGMVTSITVRGKTQVIIEVKEPYGVLLPLLASLQASPLSPASFKDGKLSGVPVGCGPFVVDRQGTGRHLELVPNPRFNRQRPRLARINVVSCPKGSVRYLWLASGRGELVEGLSNRDADVLKAKPAYRVESVSGLGLITLFLNPQVSPFQSPLLREAVVRAIPNDLLSRHLFEGKGVAFRSLFPPWCWGSRGAFKNYPFDLLEAQQLLKMGDIQKSGTAFVMWVVPKTDEDRQGLEAFLDDFRASLREVNISVLMEIVPFEQLEKRLAALQPGAILSWSTPCLADPDEIACGTFDRANPLCKFIGVPVEEVQTTIRQARAKDSRTAREFLYGEFEARIAQNLTFVSLASPVRNVGYSARLANVRIGADGVVLLEEAQINP